MESRQARQQRIIEESARVTGRDVKLTDKKSGGSKRRGLALARDPARRLSEAEENKIVALYLAGKADQDIADLVNIPITSVRRIRKQAQQSIAVLDSRRLRSLLADRFLVITHRHKASTSELIDQFYRTQTVRDNLTELVSEWQNKDIPEDKDKRKLHEAEGQQLQRRLATADQRLEGLAKSLSKLDSDFVDQIVRMGVPDVPNDDDDRSPTPKSAGVLSAVYEDLTDKEAILVQIEEASQRQQAWVDRQRKKSEKRESK